LSTLVELTGHIPGLLPLFRDSCASENLASLFSNERGLLASLFFSAALGDALKWPSASLERSLQLDDCLTVACLS